MTISKMQPAVRPVFHSLNSTFWLINDPKTATPYNQWFKSNLDKSYKVTSSKSYHFDISHVTISKMDRSAFSLI